MAKLWHVDGVGCVGKSHFVATQMNNCPTAMMDFTERCERHHFFRRKHQDQIVQILYTSSFCLTETNNDTIWRDRSPISDIWYELVFKHHDDREYQETTLNMIQELKLFDKIPTVFIIPHICHAEEILQKIRNRANKLDYHDIEYVRKQINVFELIARKFTDNPNVRFIRIEKELTMFTADYYETLKQRIINSIR